MQYSLQSTDGLQHVDQLATDLLHVACLSGPMWHERMEGQLVGNLWSFIVAHFKNAWNAIAQWFQKPHRITLIGAIVFLMLALVLSSSLVVDNLFIGSVHKDSRLETLFQWTAYVSQTVVIVFMTAFALAGLCLLYATVRVSMAQAEVRRQIAGTKAAQQKAIQSVLSAAGEAAEELAEGIESGKYRPEVAVPLIAVANDIINSHELAPAEAKGRLPLDSGGQDSGGQLSIAAPNPMPHVDKVPPDDIGEDARIAPRAKPAEVEESTFGE